MRLRVAAVLALIGLSLVAGPRAGAQDGARKPTVIVRISSLDRLVADASYLADKAGVGDMARQVEGLLKSMTGPKGLEGVDTTKPMGLYARLGPNGIDSDVVVLLPVADEETVLAFLKKQNVEFAKEEGGLYSLKLPRSPFPAFFRFANGYAYATIREAKIIAPAGLLDPARVLAGAGEGVAALTVNLDEIPDELKKDLVLSQLELRIEEAKEKVRAETDAQKQLALAAIDETFAQVKAVLLDGTQLRLGLDIDRQKDDLALAFSLTGKAGSGLAREITDLGQVTSVAASILGENAAMSGMIHYALPERIRKALAPVVDELVEKGSAQPKREAEREAVEQLLKAVAPTAKAGILDAGMSMRGPTPAGAYTVLVAAQVKDGLAVEAALKKLVALAPDEARGRAEIKIDRDKVGSVNIHSFKAQDLEENARKILGEDTVYFAVRDDALLVALGADALAALKEAIPARPASGKLLQGHVSVAQLVPLVPPEKREQFQTAVKDVFGKGGSDRISAVVEGGDSLTARVSLKAQLLELAVKMGQANAARN